MRIVDVAALALVLLCALCAAYNSMDLAELLRGRQRLAEQKRAMDGMSFSSVLSFILSPKKCLSIFCQSLILLVIESVLKNKMFKRQQGLPCEMTNL